MFADLLPIVAPIYACAGLGFLWAKTGRRYDSNLISDLIMNIGAPCLVFSSLIAVEVDSSRLWAMSSAALLALVASAVLGLVALRARNLQPTSYLAPLVFPNAGNIGLPVCFFAYGDPGLAYAVCFFTTVTLIHFSAGLWLWSGRVEVGTLLKMPLGYAAGLAVLVIATGWEAPLWLRRTTEQLGGFTIPLLQFTLGVSLGQIALVKLSRSLYLAVTRLAVGFAVGVTIAAALDFQGVARGVLILECSMPAAVTNFLLAQRYGRASSEVASVVLLSTLIAFLTLPFLLAWLL